MYGLNEADSEDGTYMWHMVHMCIDTAVLAAANAQAGIGGAAAGDDDLDAQMAEHERASAARTAYDDEAEDFEGREW